MINFYFYFFAFQDIFILYHLFIIQIPLIFVIINFLKDLPIVIFFKSRFVTLKCFLIILLFPIELN